MRQEDFIMMPVPLASFAAVCALLGGASSVAVAAATPKAPVASPATSEVAATEASKPVETGSAAASSESSDTSTVDAHGHPWSADLHAATKGTTKDGLWRMKVGVSRPDPLPGFPKETGGTGTEASGSAATGTEASAGATAANASAGQDDDDEFAAFRAAAAASDAGDAKAAAEVPARKWTEADLSALCNQAAGKAGDPAPIKTVIAEFVPTGEPVHSRNIPEDKRAAFAAALQAKVGFEFAG